ncbi:MAG: hypothetical protein JJ871_11135 [Thalassospira sp.]|uniref:hypothetical protein n=1 Tax=Thalassospira sp. TaxID=1912094 RepID=UPI001B1F1A02|nr:hypothetical protein [Thalassospira sp.]MBO6580666.1 hypothetical protein [Thalassospira sp.]MBO6802355.1 hypothetical protein [Thalassospira sp.]MBO6819602.1 hypothetical protein [Thalassospira sp.]MBO6888611.1 hypothetical protein [Thalassospira sp.]
MGSWIEQHATLLQIGVSIATLMVWIFYAQLLFQSYRRVRRPKIVINQMLGNSDKARFLISNMSQEAIHIDKVLVCIGDETHQVCEQVTDSDPEVDFQTDQGSKSAHAARLEELTVQGPLESGRCIELGALQNLMRRITHQARASDKDTSNDADAAMGEGKCRIEIIVIAVYSSEKGVIGASRAFVCDEDGQLHPEMVQTTQHAGFFARRRMARLHAQYA